MKIDDREAWFLLPDRRGLGRLTYRVVYRRKWTQKLVTVARGLEGTTAQMLRRTHNRMVLRAAEKGLERRVGIEGVTLP